MFGIGMPELIIIFVIALLVFGPKELPKIGKTIGKAMGEFRRASDELKEGIQREIEMAEREQTEPTPSHEAASSTVPSEPPAAAPEPQLELPMAQAPASSAPPAGTPEVPPAAATVTSASPSQPTPSTVAAAGAESPAPTPAGTQHV